MPFKPFPDEVGKRIYDEISWDAWQMWLKDSVKYINTYRLDLADPAAQAFLKKQMAVYFGFEEGDLAQTAWTPEQQAAGAAAAAAAAGTNAAAPANAGAAAPHNTPNAAAAPNPAAKK